MHIAYREVFKRAQEIEGNMPEAGLEYLEYFVSGVRHAIGVFRPGRYDAGECSSEEHLKITSGVVFINGIKYTEGMGVVFPKGTHLVFEVAVPSTYFCTYHA